MHVDFTVGVVGNPNCGKTTLFNALTGARQYVGNWPGVTVEKKVGYYTDDAQTVELVDLPGTYSLEVVGDEVAPDERIARDYVMSRAADLIVNIVDAANIERNLYLTTQLLEMRVPMLVALNMIDVAQQKGIAIDVSGLSAMLGCPVVAISAATHQGLDQLRQMIRQAIVAQPIPSCMLSYHPAVEQAITALLPDVAPYARQQGYDARWLAVRLLEEDSLALSITDASLAQQAARLRQSVERNAGEDIDILAADARYDLVGQLTAGTVKKTTQLADSTSERIDRIVLNRWLGIPIFFLVMYGMFMLTINVGGAFVDFFDQAVGALLVEGVTHWLAAWQWPEWIIFLLAQGLGSGVQVVATFIPIVGMLFLCLSFLEDSGYMARAAFVMDRAMRFVGLPGKSFVPMIVGFGCNVPAIMATRTLEKPRDRILTNLMNPFMSCGARLPVYALFAAAFFPHNGQNIVFALYLIGIGAAVFTGLVMRYTVFRGVSAPFIMELPNYHWPTWRNIGLRTWDRLKGFIVNAGKVIVPMVLILNLLHHVDTNGELHAEPTEHSLLRALGQSLIPLFRPMGLNEKNWPATVGIITGVLAKEAVVGTLNTLYSQLDEVDAPAERDSTFDLGAALSEAFTTIPDNLGTLTQRLLDPLGLDWGDLTQLEDAASAQQVSVGTYRAMRARFDGAPGAFAYLLFILLYAPCVAATAALYREIGWRWTLFVVVWTTGLAYLTALSYYQLARLPDDPGTALTWIAMALSIVLGIVIGLGLYARLCHHASPGDSHDFA